MYRVFDEALEDHLSQIKMPPPDSALSVPSRQLCPTQMSRPSAASNPLLDPGDFQRVDDQWTEQRSAATGEVYYYNRRTGQSEWARPTSQSATPRDMPSTRRARSPTIKPPSSSSEYGRRPVPRAMNEQLSSSRSSTGQYIDLMMKEIAELRALVTDLSSQVKDNEAKASHARTQTD